MTVAQPETRAARVSALRMLGKLVGHVGGFLTGVGVAYFMLTWATWRFRNLGASLPGFLVALVIVLAGYQLVRRRPSPDGAGGAAVLGELARTTLPWVFAFLVIATFLRGFDMSMDKAYRAAMKSDLRNLYEDQAELHRDSGKYVTESDSFIVSTGVSRPRISLTTDGWYAFVSYDWIGERCGIYVGSRPAEGPMTNEGEPACERIGGVPFRWGQGRTALRNIAIGLLVCLVGAYLVRRASPLRVTEASG